MTLPSFAGFVIREYRADCALYFTASSEAAPDVYWQVDIATDFTVTPRDATGGVGESFVVEVEVATEQASPFFATLPGKRFVELRVGEESELILELEDMTITAHADPQHESWAVHGNCGEELRCYPDREIGYAPPHPPKDTRQQRHRPLTLPSFAGFVIRGVEPDWPLRFWAGAEGVDEDWLITVQVPFTLSGQGIGDALEPLTIDLEHPDENSVELLKGLIGRRIVKLSVGPDSELIIQLGNGVVAAAADPDFESWEVLGSRGEGWECFPGAEVGYAPPRPPKDTAASGDPAT